MGLNRSDYYDITCNAKVNNLRAPVCPSISDGQLFNADDVIAKATEQGWVQRPNGKDWDCPMHAPTAAPPAKNPPKKREQILDAPAAEFPGGQ